MKGISMNKLHAGLMGALVATAVGCTQQTPGGPGVANPAPSSGATSTSANRPTYSDSADTFSLSVPTLATRVTQGESKTAKIGLSRGSKFREDVTLRFENVPQGISIDPLSPSIASGESDAAVNITADADAAAGDFSIKVIGHPTTGADATSELKLVVSQK